jgi:hypothetical protein
LKRLKIYEIFISVFLGLASSYEYHRSMLDDGILSLLLAQSLSKNSIILFYSALAITKFAQNFEIRQRITYEKCLHPVLYLTNSSENTIISSTIHSLSNLSYCDENKVHQFFNENLCLQ